MNMVYGYCRISTPKQNIERQVRNILTEYPQAKIIKEVYTGKTAQRPEFDKLLKRLQTGDTVVFDSVSRMSRNAIEGFELYKNLFEKGINLVFLKEHHIDTTTYRKELERQISLNISTSDEATDKLMTTILQALNTYIMHLAERQIYLAFDQSEKEVQDLRERTREGIETARRNGKQIGGHKEGVKLVIKKEAPIKELIKKHSKTFGGSLKDNEVIAVINSVDGLHIARNTYYKYKADLMGNADTSE